MSSAEGDLSRALELSPNDPNALHWFSLYLAARGRTDEAVVQKTIETDVPPIFDYLESQLSDNATALVGGKFSIGDIGVATQFVNLRHAKFTVDASRWPKLAKYIANVHARPSFKAVIDEEEAMFKPK